ncbi:MAG: hypothetical protein PHD95_01365 [Candidatus ainarchaeum sp.]|nr:hypothetical protein [Candidatus ainarchaeum sp.]
MEKLMIEKSDELLYEFFRRLGKNELEEIGLMGGWAVHYLLKNKDVVHIGSRDIDIFFDPAKIKPKVIEEKLKGMGFHPHSTFRWVRIFHSETEKELGLEESKKHPIYNLSYIYFDIATPVKIGHSMPEPLLKKVFKKEKEHVKIKDIQILVPSPKIMIEMKLKSIPGRSDAFKRTKDIADLYALLNSHHELWLTKKGELAKTKGLNKKLVKNFKEGLERFKIDGTIAASATMLRIGQDKLTGLLEKI